MLPVFLLVGSWFESAPVWARSERWIGHRTGSSWRSRVSGSGVQSRANSTAWPPANSFGAASSDGMASTPSTAPHPLRSSVVTASMWAGGMIAITLALPGCSMPYIPGVTSPPPSAGVTLRDANGREVGNAVLVQEDGGVRVLLDVKGLTPGTKAVHVHEVGRCDPPSFESAGAHFNPTRAEHGLENPRGPHAGDLPNLTVDATGQGHLEFTATRVNLKQGAASLLDGSGTALIVHESPDDMRTDPTGNSGPRIACGVVNRAG